jgi:hypothetical protein
MPENANPAVDHPEERPNVSARPRATTGETVTVCCKLPNGLVLHVDEMVEVTEPTPSGARMVRMARPIGDPITLNGCAINVATLMNGGLDQPPVGGFGLTHGVPKEFWDAWLDQNKNTDLVRRGLVFATKNAASAHGMARERATEVRSGMEPVDPENLPREFRRQRTPGGGITGIQKMNHGDNDADNL